MTAINFPNSPPPYNGQVYVADNGIIYIFNDGRWTGQVVSSAVPSQLVNNAQVFALDPDGKLHLPQGAVLSDDGSSVYLQPDDNNTDSVLQVSAPNDIVFANTDTDQGIVVGNSDSGAYITVQGNSAGNNIEFTTYDANNDSSNVWVLTSDGHTVFPNGTINSGLTALGLQSNANSFIKYVDIDLDTNNTVARVDEYGFRVEVALDGIGTYDWHFDIEGNLTVPGDIQSTSTLGLYATQRTQVRHGPFNLANVSDSGMNSISAVAGDLVYNTTRRELMVYADNAWRRVVRTTFNDDIVLTNNGNFRNSQGVRVAYTNEIPRDISELTDTAGMLNGSGDGPITEDMRIDGGAAYATYGPTTTRVDGGGSATRFGAASTVFDGVGAGGGNYTLNLNGGGA